MTTNIFKKKKVTRNFDMYKAEKKIAPLNKDVHNRN